MRAQQMSVLHGDPTRPVLLIHVPQTNAKAAANGEGLVWVRGHGKCVRTVASAGTTYKLSKCKWMLLQCNSL